MPEPLAVTVRPLTPDRWPDLESVFEAKGCSIARGCWCMYYRESGRPPPAPGQRIADARRAALRALCDAGPPPGLIAYAGRQPVGWVTLGPREVYARLARSPVMKPVDAEPVWSIVCFLVPPEFRHRGVAAQLLEAAVKFARRQGAKRIEGYPVDKREPGRDDWLWHGAKSMFDRAGFVEIARRKPTRPVVRLSVGAASKPTTGRVAVRRK